MLKKRDLENRNTFFVVSKGAYKTIRVKLSFSLGLYKYMHKKRHFESRATFLSCQKDTYKI